MIKIEQWEAFVTEALSERILANMESINEDYKRNKNSISEEFITTLNRLFQHCICLQEEGKKGKIAIINICYLRVSCLTGKMKLQVSLYDNNWYLDRTEVCGTWNPDFIYKYYYEDLEYIQRECKQNIVGFGHKEVQQLKQRLAMDYHAITLKLLFKLSSRITLDEAFLKMQKENGLLVMFGGYMEQGIPVMRWEQVSQEEKECGTL